MALPVRYGVVDHRVYFRLPEYNDACHFIDRADVALDVEAATPGRLLIVRVSGVALMISAALLPGDSAEMLDAWPPEVCTSTVVLVPESVHRIPSTDDLRYPPVPADAGLPGTFVDPF